MSLHALSSGTLATDPIKRTGTKGNPYVTASLRGRFGAERVLEVRHHD